MCVCYKGIRGDRAECVCVIRGLEREIGQSATYSNYGSGRVKLGYVYYTCDVQAMCKYYSRKRDLRSAWCVCVVVQMQMCNSSVDKGDRDRGRNFRTGTVVGM